MPGAPKGALKIRINGKNGHLAVSQKRCVGSGWRGKGTGNGGKTSTV